MRDDPTLTQRTASAGLTMILSPPETLRAKLESEIPRWQRIVQDLGLKPE
jgi:tripartite-type tricarboxylate transporter receptor subunit TctC